jgi:dTDP-4-amino-4,6-dideoxygalactose transaminase
MIASRPAMLPRTKVNYGWRDLGRALLTSEAASASRARLTALLAGYQHAHHVLLTPSGRAGLYFLLRASDRPRVVVPGYTCKAVTEAALLAGKDVVHVDVDDGFNLGASALADQLDDRTIVIATHQFGIPCQIEAICALARRHGALVFEDAAAALGSRVNGRLVGTFGDAAFFSFDSTKLVHVPLKAGFVTVRDAGLFARVREVHDRETAAMSVTRKLALLVQAAILLGLEQPHLYRVFHKLHFEWRGRFTADDDVVRRTRTRFYSDRIAEWQAAIAVPQVERLDDLVERRRALYRELRARLVGCGAIELPPGDDRREWACIRFPVLVRGDRASYYREATSRGVDFAFSFSFLAGSAAAVPASHRIADRILDVPYYQKLTEADVDRVTDVLRELEGMDL